MKTKSRESAAPLQPPPETATLQHTEGKKWRGLGIELKELGRRLVDLLKRSFQFHSLHSYQITVVDSPSPQVKNRKARALDELLKQTTNQVKTQSGGMLEKSCKDIASAFLVMHGLAKYQSPAEGPRTDFTLIPARTYSAQVSEMQRMIKGMTWPQMQSFYRNDALVIPRTAGVLKGTGRLLAGQKRRLERLLKHSTPAADTIDPGSVAKQKLAMSNPASVFVAVYGDRTPGQAGHVALFIGGKGENPGKPLYVSHLGMNRSTLENVRTVLPGVKVESTSNTFEEDCKQFGIPDYVVELTGLNHDAMVKHLQQAKGKGYDLLTRNCSTHAGELLLAGLPGRTKQATKKPDGFWTPYDITVMAQQLWKREQIDKPDW